MTVGELRSDLFHYDDTAQVVMVTPDITNINRLSCIIGIYSGGMEGQQKQLILVGDREGAKTA